MCPAEKQPLAQNENTESAPHITMLASNYDTVNTPARKALESCFFPPSHAPRRMRCVANLVPDLCCEMFLFFSILRDEERLTKAPGIDVSSLGLAEARPAGCNPERQPVVYNEEDIEDVPKMSTHESGLQ